jgi:hypothetical protein
MPTDFSTEYSHRRDDELLRLASERDALTGEAAAALDVELRRRNFTDSDVIEYQKFARLQERLEQRNQRRKASGTLADPQSLLNKLVALAFGGGIYFAYRAIPNPYRLSPGWEQAATNVLVAATVIVYMMGDWRKVSFWRMLTISSTIQLLVLRIFAERLPKFDYGPSTIGIVIGIIIFFLLYAVNWIWQRNAAHEDSWTGQSE